MNVKSPTAIKSHEKRLTLFCAKEGGGLDDCIGVGVEPVMLLDTVKVAVWFSAAGMLVPL